MADRIGSLRPGKQADLMLVGGPSIGQHPHLDAAGTLVFQTTPADVRTVLVAGRVVKRDGVLVGVDLPELLHRGDRSAEQVLRRVPTALPGTPEGGFKALGQAGASASLGSLR
ncbi:MAG TPA: hypothetical protein VGH72_25885 [Pseudonocardia sp.]|jgi:cytosine/adenosine deaminase-related metal-dependent hydrolase